MGTWKSTAELASQASMSAHLQRLLGGARCSLVPSPCLCTKVETLRSDRESGSLAGNKTTRVCLPRDLQFGLGLE